MAFRASSGSGSPAARAAAPGDHPRTTTRPAKISSNAAAARGPARLARRSPRAGTSAAVHAQETDRLEPGLRRLSRHPDVQFGTERALGFLGGTAGLHHRRHDLLAARPPRARRSWRAAKAGPEASCRPARPPISGPWSSAMLSWISNPSATGICRLPKSTRLSGGMSSARVQRPHRPPPPPPPSPRGGAASSPASSQDSSSPGSSQASSSPGSSQVFSSSGPGSSLTSSREPQVRATSSRAAPTEHLCFSPCLFMMSGPTAGLRRR